MCYRCFVFHTQTVESNEVIQRVRIWVIIETTLSHINLPCELFVKVSNNSLIQRPVAFFEVKRSEKLDSESEGEDSTHNA